jgi:hypothetical protein
VPKIALRKLKHNCIVQSIALLPQSCRSITGRSDAIVLKKRDALLLRNAVGAKAVAGSLRNKIHTENRFDAL